MVCDSDRSAPHPEPDEPTEKVKRLRDATQTVGAPDPFVLPLRTAENYLPDEFWRAWLAEDRARTGYRDAV